MVGEQGQRGELVMGTGAQNPQWPGREPALEMLSPVSAGQRGCVGQAGVGGDKE